MAGGRGESAMTEQVLLVLHQEQSTPGRVALALRDRGYALDIRRPRYGDLLPATMDEHAGAVIFGGPQSANDPDDFIKAEIDFIGVPLRAGKPYLGICLGAQMLAKHLGERVAPHPQGKAEVGYYPVRPTARGSILRHHLTIGSRRPGHNRYASWRQSRGWPTVPAIPRALLTST